MLPMMTLLSTLLLPKVFIDVAGCSVSLNQPLRMTVGISSFSTSTICGNFSKQGALSGPVLSICFALEAAVNEDGLCWNVSYKIPVLEYKGWAFL